jgi:hypothetical protein
MCALPVVLHHHGGTVHPLQKGPLSEDETRDLFVPCGIVRCMIRPSLYRCVEKGRLAQFGTRDGRGEQRRRGD